MIKIEIFKTWNGKGGEFMMLSLKNIKKSYTTGEFTQVALKRN